MGAQQSTNSGFGRTTEPQEVLSGIDLTGKVAIVTGGLEGHDPLPQVEGGGQDALSLV